MNTAADPPASIFDHSMYRMAHLHGNRWVTFTPDEQHDPSEDGPAWAGATVLRCSECDERVVVAPA